MIWPASNERGRDGILCVEVSNSNDLPPQIGQPRVGSSTIGDSIYS